MQKSAYRFYSLSKRHSFVREKFTDVVRSSFSMETTYFTLLVLMVVVWSAGRLFQIMNLPIVFGEVLGGILVGPTLLNLVDPESDVIHILSELGVFFLMLHVGLKTNHKQLLSSSKNALFIAIGGMVATVLGGYIVSALFGYSLNEALFVGIALSISAIAVAARAFRDVGIKESPLADVTFGAAILTDIVGLILFSLVLDMGSGTVDIGALAWLLAKVSIFFLVVIWGGVKLSPYLSKVLYRGNKGFSLALIFALAIGYAAERMGLHVIIGAFLAGLFIREEMIDQKVFDKIEDRVYGLSYSFFGPIFFASLAFYLDFQAVGSAPLFLFAVIGIALLGKIAGSGGIARLLGYTRTEASTIGLALNNRGAVEMVLATVGLENGIIDTKVFSVIVLMTFATTFISVAGLAPLAKRLPAYAT